MLQPGDTLVANFNDANNVQGTGTTIVRITPTGQVSTFFTSSLQGVTTTPVILKSGFVIVGNVPNAEARRGRPGRDKCSIRTANSSRRLPIPAF